MVSIPQWEALSFPKAIAVFFLLTVFQTAISDINFDRRYYRRQQQETGIT
jgi:hypothetical protein